VSQDILKHLYYMEGHLFWSETIHNKCQKDSPAGTTKQTGYREIQFRYKRYYAHRLIWEMFYGPIDSKLVIDHIDGNPSNNEITNLRCVEHVVNLHGARKATRNKSGFIGVSWNKLTKSWEASVTYKGKRIFRNYYNDIHEAAQAVAKVRLTTCS